MTVLMLFLRCYPLLLFLFWHLCRPRNQIDRFWIVVTLAVCIRIDAELACFECRVGMLRRLEGVSGVQTIGPDKNSF
jgi:hypothetical protein